MATLEEFKALRAGVAPEVQTELYGLMSSDPEAGKQRMVELAAEKGMTLSPKTVRVFLCKMNEESEFDDIELDAVALAAIAGGTQRDGNCRQEEAHDEPWGRCPGMRPMRKWLLGRKPVA